LISISDFDWVSALHGVISYPVLRQSSHPGSKRYRTYIQTDRTSNLPDIGNTLERLPTPLPSATLIMAPTPVGNTLSASPTSTSKSDDYYWKPSNIAFTAVASALALGVVLAAIAFFIYRHRQHKKIAQSIPAKEGLLAGEERKSSMFSRERASSVTVYVDHATTDTAYKRVSQEPAPLVPLHVNTQIPAASAGSGVSALSRNSNGTLGTLMLSPVSENGSRPAGRPRSTSTSSVRYYAVTPTDTTIPVPKIVHTVSD
jgi:hypothetical protein